MGAERHLQRLVAPEGDLRAHGPSVGVGCVALRLLQRHIHDALHFLADVPQVGGDGYPLAGLCDALAHQTADQRLVDRLGPRRRPAEVVLQHLVDDAAPLRRAQPGLGILFPRCGLFLPHAHLRREGEPAGAVVRRFQHRRRPHPLAKRLCPPLRLSLIHDWGVFGDGIAAVQVHIRLCQGASFQYVDLRRPPARVSPGGIVIDRGGHQVLASHVIHPRPAEQHLRVPAVAQQLPHRVPALQRAVPHQAQGRREGGLFLVVQQREFPAQFVIGIPAHAQQYEVPAVHIQGIFAAAAVYVPRRLGGVGVDPAGRGDGLHDAQVRSRAHVALIDSAHLIHDVSVEVVLDAALHAPVQQVDPLSGDLPYRLRFRFKKAHPVPHQPAGPGLPFVFAEGQLFPALRPPAHVAAAEQAQHLQPRQHAPAVAVVQGHRPRDQGRRQRLHVIIPPGPVQQAADEQRRGRHGSGHAEGGIHGDPQPPALLFQPQAIGVVRTHDHGVFRGDLRFDQVLQRPADLGADVLTVHTLRQRPGLFQRYRGLEDSIAGRRVTCRRSDGYDRQTPFGNIADEPLLDRGKGQVRQQGVGYVLRHPGGAQDLRFEGVAVVPLPLQVFPPYARQQPLAGPFQLFRRHLAALQFVQQRQYRFGSGQLHGPQRGEGIAGAFHDLLQRDGGRDVVDLLKLPRRQHRLRQADHVSAHRHRLHVHRRRAVGCRHADELIACLHAPAQQHLFAEPVPIQPCAQFAQKTVHAIPPQFTDVLVSRSPDAPAVAAGHGQYTILRGDVSIRPPAMRSRLLQRAHGDLFFQFPPPICQPLEVRIGRIRQCLPGLVGEGALVGLVVCEITLQ